MTKQLYQALRTNALPAIPPPSRPQRPECNAFFLNLKDQRIRKNEIKWGIPRLENTTSQTTKTSNTMLSYHFS